MAKETNTADTDSVIPPTLEEAKKAYLRDQKAEAERRSGIIAALRELDDNPDLEYLIHDPVIRHLFKTFGKRIDGMTEVYGIPLIETSDDGVMLVYTDNASTEIVEAMGITSERQPLFQTYSIVDSVDQMEKQGTSIDECAVLKDFFTGSPIGTMTVEKFRQIVRASLDTFAETLKPYGGESAGNA